MYVYWHVNNPTVKLIQKGSKSENHTYDSVTYYTDYLNVNKAYQTAGGYSVIATIKNKQQYVMQYINVKPGILFRRWFQFYN